MSAIIIGSTIVGACNSVDIPEGPSLGSLWNSYANPQGSIPSDNVEAMMDAAQLAYHEVERLGGLKFVTSTLKPVADTIAKIAGEEGSLEELVQLSGLTDVNHTCPGLASTRTSDAANGSILYKLTFKKNWLQEVIWGKFQNCQFNVSSELSGSIDGTWAISLGYPQTLRELDLNHLLVSLDGTLESEGLSEDISTNFMVDQKNFVEIQIPAENGFVIFGFGDDSSQSTLRTAEGSFCCDFDQRECLALDGDTCDSSTGDGQRITW